jgi:hypothetical protein
MRIKQKDIPYRNFIDHKQDVVLKKIKLRNIKSIKPPFGK